jgi:chemosensory pili system protein ChpA (sensor histidine kinase/response regulator)
MADLLGTRKSGAEPVSPGEYPITLVVETGGRRGTLVIDTLVGQKEIVIKSLGSHLRYVKGVSGATIMGDGSVIPILNIDELLWPQTKMLAETHTDRELIIEKPLNIMVVDDSVSIRQVVSRLMKDQGWKVLTAKDGIDALDRLSESRPDLIVLDIEMPRMNGYEFLGALKAQAGFEDIPVVMLTSRTVAKHRDKAKALGAKGFIVKPYDDDEFVRLILKLTGRGSG